MLHPVVGGETTQLIDAHNLGGKVAFVGKLSKMLFKLAVEIAMVENILANLSKYDPLSVARLRGQCVEEVKGINGMLQFEDAVDWQEAWRE